MPASTPKSAFWRGFRGGLPFILVIVPFGTLFGVVGTEAGLDIFQVLGFSFLVIAGAAQFTAVQLMSEHAPTVVVLSTALAVNLRMAMYSAALTPHMGAAPLWQRALASYFMVDQTFAVAHGEFENHKRPARENVAFFLGAAFAIAPLWYLATFVGAAAGTRIPPEFALDFAVPITFLAIVAPMLKSLAHVAAAVTSIVLSLLLVWMPFSAGLLVAAAVAMPVGAGVEIWMEARRDSAE
ncbi:MAG: AzlC family ABC transporter permease [Rhodobacteraceae bacterium]|nr:AzlC family ABC transporter permease [Paracoccaceae bacterium]